MVGKVASSSCVRRSSVFSVFLCVISVSLWFGLFKAVTTETEITQKNRKSLDQWSGGWPDLLHDFHNFVNRFVGRCQSLPELGHGRA